MSISVVIPTLNGGATFAASLEACLQQEIAESVEILVIDSASTDGTPDIAESMGVTVHRISRAEFGHGRTRNLGVHLVAGEVIAFLTQDAVPASPNWLARLVQPFAECDRVGLAFGRQLPHPQCRITVKRDVAELFGRLAEGDETVLTASAGTFGPRARFFSNVNSAIRRSTWEKTPFPDVAYSEDLAFAEAALRQGWWKAYVPTAAVRHSHDLRLDDYYRRMLAEFRGVRGVSEVELDGRLLRHVAAAGVGSVRDVLAAARDPDYPTSQRLQNAVTAPAYQVARRVAIRRSRRPAG